jgi:hypothetical protein
MENTPFLLMVGHGIHKHVNSCKLNIICIHHITKVSLSEESNTLMIEQKVLMIIFHAEKRSVD